MNKAGQLAIHVKQTPAKLAETKLNSL